MCHVFKSTFVMVYDQRLEERKTNPQAEVVDILSGFSFE